MKPKTLVVLALALSFASAYAQSDEQVLNSDPINVDGYLAERPATDHELEQIKSEIRKQKTEVQLNKQKTKGFKELSKTTEKLSDTTEEYIDEKKTAQKDIAEYNKKIKCLMEENPGKDCDKYVRNRNRDEVSTSMAAPAQVVSTGEVTTAPSGAAFETIKLSLEGGVVNYVSDNEDLRADTLGIRLESNINKRFSMSVGANYTSFTTEDFASSMYGGSPWMMSGGYYGAYGMKGREIQYKSMGLDIGAKFFIVQTERFRPYIGAALGYNMANMRYAQNNPHNPYVGGMYYQFGDEDQKMNYATGSLSAGTEIMITQRVGMNLQGAYSTGLGNSLSSRDAKNPYNSPDQARLNQLGKEIIDANAFSITAGLLVVF